MQQDRLQYLLEQYGNDQATDEERRELAAFIRENEDSSRFEEAGLSLVHTATVQVPDHYQTLLNDILQADKPPARIARRRLWWAVAAAAAILAGTILALWPQPEQQPATAQQAIVGDVAPGSTKATLTLADGSVVELDSAGNQVIREGIQLAAGQLTYDPEGDASINTLSTPRGGQFRVQLPDGSMVWLNAASSIRYPTAFEGAERVVSITGEAYFEIAKDAARPFKVKINDKEAIEVLGTQFNVNAYTNEPILSATLMEGSIRIGENVLKPGQQWQNGKIMPADISKVMAWKNGLFNFENVSLQQAMRQLERWYDITVVYEKGVPDKYFEGKMSRDVSLKGLLKVLETTGVNFRLEKDKRLIVLP